MSWEDSDDEWTQAIDAVHPSRSGSHETYATAMRMISHRHRKSALVNLVNWLLMERDDWRRQALLAQNTIAQLRQNLRAYEFKEPGEFSVVGLQKNK